MAVSVVRLQVSNYSELSDYKCTERVVENNAANASITVKETVMGMINFCKNKWKKVVFFAGETIKESHRDDSL